MYSVVLYEFMMNSVKEPYSCVDTHRHSKTEGVEKLCLDEEKKKNNNQK